MHPRVGPPEPLEMEAHLEATDQPPQPVPRPDRSSSSVFGISPQTIAITSMSPIPST